MAQKKFNKSQREEFLRVAKSLGDVIDKVGCLPTYYGDSKNFGDLQRVKEALEKLGKPPEPKVVRLIKIVSCSDCVHHRSERMYTADSFEMAFDWFCDAMDGKKAAGYVERDHPSIPDWCPLDSKVEEEE